ncbi:hypothetical protein HDU76_009092 [Blyttiomyces sp. JEL0837]|nr:hypothetical protein HDU76_009092 [Blyttiomyces sp. JEL0837]
MSGNPPPKDDHPDQQCNTTKGDAPAVSSSTLNLAAGAPGSAAPPPMQKAGSQMNLGAHASSTDLKGKIKSNANIAGAGSTGATNTGPAASGGVGEAGPHTKRQSNARNLIKLDLEDTEKTEEEQYYLNGLFSIENSPAFRALDTAKGKVSENKIKDLKEKIQSLHKYLIHFNEYEKSLQKRTKQLAQEVSNQRMDMDRNESKQFADNAEIGELKRELMRSENEVRLALEREERLQREIEETSKQKNDLSNDIDEIRKHKADMLEPQLIASTKELKLEISQRRNQVESLQKDLEEKEVMYDIVLNEKERLDIEKEKHAAALARAMEMPQKIIKQSEVLRDAISSLVIENVKQTTLGQQLDQEIERLAKRKREMEETKLDHAAAYEQKRAENDQIERENDEIFKQHEFAKEQLSVQMAEKVRLDLALRNAAISMKKEHDALLRAIRDKESQLKHHRRVQITVSNIRLSVPMLKKQSEEYSTQIEMLKRELEFHKNSLADLKKEIDLGLFEFLKMEGTEKAEMEKLTAQQELNRRMEKELEEIIEKRAELARQIEALKGERELKARDLMRVQNKYRIISGDKEIKDIAISEASKRCAESISRLREFAMLYDVVKNERNKYMNQIQATNQRAAEMKEKIKILSNEIEILRHEIMNKDRELTKKRQENTAAYAIRDAAKNEANKLLATYRERRDQIDQHLSRIETLNTLINAAEEDMVHLKQRYERAIKDRNAVGIHLLDRNDELCILYERLNVQAGVMAKGEKALIDREDEIRRLKLVKVELIRRVELNKKKHPRVAEVKTLVAELEGDLDGCRKRVAELSERIENPEDPERCRDLGGEDPGQKELLGKIKKLELLLAEKEERLLEKDLILEEVSTLTNRLKKQTLEGREESHEVAARINDLSKKIKNVTRSMMARVSELSMYQALAMGLYQEKCEKEAILETAKQRLGRGECPTEDIEKEFIRAEKKRMRREAELMALRSKKEKENMNNFIDVDEDNFFIYNEIRTTAEPRPNAYIPNSSGVGELPIPKPYGAHAPFKPQELGSQIRHFRKPQPKPVEI